MIKNFFLVILGITLLAVAVVMAHLPARHFVMQVYHGVNLFVQLEGAYQAEPFCKSEEMIKACMKKIVADNGGFKFGTDLGIAVSILNSKDVSYDAFLRGNVALVELINPQEFWIHKVKGKAAKRVFNKEKKALITALTGNKATLVKTIKENRFPASVEDQNAWVSAIDAKISELEE